MAEVIMLGVFCLLVFIIIAANYNTPTLSEPSVKIAKAKPKPKARPKAKTKKQVDPNLQLAKSTMVSMGFSATEANKLLSGISADTPESYVKQAMQRVKI